MTKAYFRGKTCVLSSILSWLLKPPSELMYSRRTEGAMLYSRSISTNTLLESEKTIVRLSEIEGKISCLILSKGNESSDRYSKITELEITRLVSFVFLIDLNRKILIKTQGHHRSYTDQPPRDTCT